MNLTEAASAIEIRLMRRVAMRRAEAAITWPLWTRAGPEQQADGLEEAAAIVRELSSGDFVAFDDRETRRERLRPAGMGGLAA